ncbi:MAG: CBS domain-containing protein [Lutibacter sp.]|jgi:hypothetical protein|nr:CBS domain-containing protein [Lutibacter sp.]
METQASISNECKPFCLDTTFSEARAFFDRVRFSHFPIVDNGTFKGLIAETDVPGADCKEGCLGDCGYLIESFAAQPGDTFLEILGHFSLNGSSLLPVVDDQKNYLGYLELLTVLQTGREMPFFQHKGKVLLLEKKGNHTAAQEVCELVSANSGKVLGLFVSKMTEQSVTITVKLDTANLDDTIRSFQSRDYRVLSNRTENSLLEALKERSDYLQKYLHI